MNKIFLKISSSILSLVILFSLFISTATAAEYQLSNSNTLPKVGGSNCKVEGQFETEWHFVISGGGTTTMPGYITANFSQGGFVQVPKTSQNPPSNQAGYTLTTHLTDTLTGATAVLPAGYTGNFVLSHWPCVKPLQVSKTADASYSRAWTWDIVKTVDETDLGLIESGDIKTINYTVKVSAEKEDSNHKVSGKITITNPTGNPDATLESVTDVLDAAGNVIVDCGVDFPYDLPSGQDLECDYSADSDGTDALNTATVTTTGIVPGGSSEADVIWGNPSSETDECVDVTDDKHGNLGTVCEDDLDQNGEYSFDYSTTFSKDQESDVTWQCGQTEYVNIASFVTNDTDADGEDSWTVNGSVICACSLSQGYWKTHSKYGPAPKDDVWVQIGEDSTFFKSAQTWYQVFWTAPKNGNAYYQLAHQYMATALNVKNGVSLPLDVQIAFNQATDLLDEYTPFQIGAMKANNPVRQEFVKLAGILGGYIDNSHCSE